MPEGAGPSAGPSYPVTRALSRNESPHDPSPGIVATVAASGPDVNRYPDPACADLTLALAHRHGVEPDRVPPTCLVALDEAYFEYVDEPVGTGGLALRGEYPNLVVLRTFSKADAGPFGSWCARAGVELRVFDGDGVRVSIGAPSDNDAFLAAIRRWRTRGAPQLLTTGAVG
ncbi:hypothetical protein ABZ436_08225 [Micromonospora matsumotoense]